MSISPQINEKDTGTKKGCVPMGIIILAVSFNTWTEQAVISDCHSSISELDCKLKPRSMIRNFSRQPRKSQGIVAGINPSTQKQNRRRRILYLSTVSGQR